MHFDEQRSPALLSFCLPGLGQIAQQRWPWAAMWFALFFFTLAVMGTWWAVPLIAIAAGAETFRSPRTGGMKEPTRKTMYGAIGALGFLAWGSFVALHFLPARFQMALNDDVDNLRAIYRGCRTLHHGKDESVVMDCLRADMNSTITDPWGTHYSFSSVGHVFEIRSAGPDKSLGNADDLVYPLFVKEGQSE